MSLLLLVAASVVAAGQSFDCTPTRVWDGDGPIWCAEGPRIRLSGRRRVRSIVAAAMTNRALPCHRLAGYSASMTISPLERAARAIATEIGVDPDRLITADDDAHVGLGLRQPHLAWTRYVGTARAVLQAIQVPSPEMLRAGWNATKRDGAAVDHHDIHVAFVAMIDAALEEGGA